MNRPKTRGDCIGGPRPCPWVGCRHHLFLEVKENGNILFNFKSLSEMSWTCSLDVADEYPGGVTDRKELGDLIGRSKSRVSTLLEDALGILRGEFEGERNE